MPFLSDEFSIVALVNGNNGNPAKISRQVATWLDPKFTQFAKLNFTELMAMYQRMVTPSGSPEEVASLKRTTLGDAQVCTYRARCDLGVVDVRVGYAVTARSAIWTSPLLMAGRLPFSSDENLQRCTDAKRSYASHPCKG